MRFDAFLMFGLICVYLGAYRLCVFVLISVLTVGVRLCECLLLRGLYCNGLNIFLCTIAVVDFALAEKVNLPHGGCQAQCTTDETGKLSPDSCAPETLSSPGTCLQHVP